MLKLKINGVLEIEEPLEKEKDYSICLKRVALKDTVTRENESGKTITFITENQDIVTLVSEDKVIIAKPTKYSQSQALRFAIEKNWEEQLSGSGLEKEDYYKKRIADLIKIEGEIRYK